MAETKTRQIYSTNWKLISVLSPASSTLPSSATATIEFAAEILGNKCFDVYCTANLYKVYFTFSEGTSRGST